MAAAVMPYFVCAFLKKAMRKKYLIDFRIYEQTWSDSFGRTCPDCVNEDNVEAWGGFYSLENWA